MKNIKLVFILSIVLSAMLRANPIDDTPIAKFSELVLDSNNNWKIEVAFSYWNNSYIDSIVFKTSNSLATYFPNYADETFIDVISSDSLSVPLNINRLGDKINIYTYSTIYYDTNYSRKGIREDSLLFGSYTGATVGAPVDGHSILRFTLRLESNDYLSIDCLVQTPSLGVENSHEGLNGTLKGYIYNKNNNLINNYYSSYSGYGFFILEAPVEISSDGSYTTPVFNTIYKSGHIKARIVNFEGYSSEIEIEPFELENIKPDTVINQDIRLISDCEYCLLVSPVNGIEDSGLPLNYDITLINYPNPFNPSTNFYIKIPDRLRSKSKVINIYNVTGELIKNIPIDGDITASWNGTDSKGRTMPSGIYYYRLNIENDVVKNGSMILLK